MKFGQARQDGSSFDVHKWHDDWLPECLTNDQLWGYMIQAVEEMTKDTWGGIKDPVLQNLMRIGIFGHTDRQDQCLNQTLLAIQHSTAIALRILPCLLELETKVDIACLFLMTTDAISSRGTTWREISITTVGGPRLFSRGWTGTSLSWKSVSIIIDQR